MSSHTDKFAYSLSNPIRILVCTRAKKLQIFISYLDIGVKTSTCIDRFFHLLFPVSPKFKVLDRHALHTSANGKPSAKLLRSKLFVFRCSTMKIHASDHLNSTENSFFQSSVSGFHSVRPDLPVHFVT